jgi:hypothetical protein
MRESVSTDRWLMVVILIVAICPESIFLIVIWVSRDPRHRPNILDVGFGGIVCSRVLG